ncbi:MAG: RluA family pseudouridine synthase [Candidatus Omnitrophica bacterium]|nr:RluA family pseudouridine synthase [Candidatus Omnitrophota bacterium]
MQTLRVAGPDFLLNYLFKNLPGLKKTKIRQVLKYGSVRVNGRVVTSHRHALEAGDLVDLLSEKEAFTARLRARLDFPLVYEDEAILVVDKPPGLLTMGTDRRREQTLYFKLTDYVRAKSPDGRGRVFIVHRLDRESSGLLVFAKSEKTKRALQENWDRAVKKYYAITEGVPAKKEGVIESHLVEDAFKRVYSSAPKRSRRSKHAVTRYRVFRQNGRYALLDVTLETGRKNQIRVHLSDLGHPIAGDAKYGARTDPIGRLALHAYYLSFPHPSTGGPKAFHSRLPKDFETLPREGGQSISFTY